MNSFAFSDDELDAFFPTAPLAPHSHESQDYSVRIDLKPLQVSSAPAPASKPKRSSNKRPGSFQSKSDMIPLPTGVVPARCGYRTGKCQNLQAVKRNGKLHKLCEFHREKANMNQKKLDRKKRMQRTSPFDSFSSEDDAMSEKSSPRAIDDASFVEELMGDCDVAPAPTSLHEAPLVLGCEEIAIFYSLMTFDIHQRAALRRPHPTPAYAYQQQAFMSTV